MMHYLPFEEPFSKKPSFTKKAYDRTVLFKPMVIFFQTLDYRKLLRRTLIILACVALLEIFNASLFYVMESIHPSKHGQSLINYEIYFHKRMGGIMGILAIIASCIALMLATINKIFKHW